MSTPVRVPFADLRITDEAGAIRDAIDRVLLRGWYVLGPELEAFEVEFAAAAGARHAVGVGNGTDALALALRAIGVESGDEVLVPAITAAYTGLAVVAAGARPVIVDVEPDTLTIDAAACAAAITPRTRGMIPVHLFGQPANLDRLRALAERHSLFVLEDCCQAHGARHRDVPVGTTTIAGAFSFYPTKNLGALGDGGAVITNDDQVAQRVRRLRNGGQTDRYHHLDAGANSRLDELQAAILRVRLPHLAGFTARRRELAVLYRQQLPPDIMPVPERDAGHVYHLFPVRCRQRDALQMFLGTHGIETLIHYPLSLPEQPAFSAYRPAACPVARTASRELLSLPLHPRLSSREVAAVADVVGAFVKKSRPA